MGDGQSGRGRRCRPFTILDAMILVVATAGALAYLRLTPDAHDYFEDRLDGFNSTSDRMLAGEWVASAFLPPWTLCWLVLRARSPRPRSARLWRQPGLIACASAFVALVAWVPLSRLYSRSWEEVSRQLGWFMLIQRVNDCGLIVLVAWVVLAVARAWRTEPGWIDRAGRSLGVSWIVLYLASIAEQVVRSYGW